MRYALCLCLLVGCQPIFDALSPAKVELVHLETGSCGEFTVTLSVPSASSVRVLLDDRVLWSGTTTHDEPLRLTGVAAPGTVGTLFVEGATEEAFQTALALPGTGSLLKVSDGEAPSGQPAWWLVSLAPACADLQDQLTLSTQFGDLTLRQETFEDLGVRVAIPDLGVGERSLTAQLTGPGDVLLYQASAQWKTTAKCTDVDKDGVSTCDGDCDDTRADIHPGATEIRGDRLDNDCDGVNGLDQDLDGYEDRAAGGLDCDDRNPAIHPKAIEWIDADQDGAGVGDGLDNDCDGVVDNDIAAVDCDDSDPTVNPAMPEAPAPNEKDDDCDGLVDEGTVAFDDDGDGLAELDGDCDDDDAQIFPDAAERPNCLDDDCDDEVDEGVTRPKREDGYEKNDTKDTAYNLATDGMIRSFHDLRVVTSRPDDEEWFRFYSDDGPFDDWRIVAHATSLGAGMTYEIQIVDTEDTVRASAILDGSGNRATVTGRALFPDSGTYFLVIRPKKTPRTWCPAEIRLESW